MKVLVHVYLCMYYMIQMYCRPSTTLGWMSLELFRCMILKICLTTIVSLHVSNNTVWFTRRKQTNTVKKTVIDWLISPKGRYYLKMHCRHISTYLVPRDFVNLVSHAHSLMVKTNCAEGKPDCFRSRTVHVDGQAPLDDSISADTLTTRFGSPVCTGFVFWRCT